MDLGNSANWREEDLQALIANKVEESTILDYKQREALLKADVKKDLSKDVSAFANSAGGILVYGIIEDHHVPTQIDEGLSPTEITKEWLEQVLQGNIGPRINGVHINPVRLDTTHPGKVVYVVTVPQGTTAHQASDLRYYKRFNFESVPMEDHEIKDVMSRFRHPLIDPVFSYEFLKKGEPHEYKLIITLVNRGAMRARDIKIVFYWPRLIRTEIGVRYSQRIIRGRICFDNPESDSIEHTIQMANTIIFPQDELRITEDSAYRFTYFIGRDAYHFINTYNPRLVWKIFADDMPPQEGKVFLRDFHKY